MLKDKLAVVTASITIIAFIYAGYTKLATKSDLQRAAIVSNFKWSESNIKINELMLENLDQIKLKQTLTTSEQRKYKAIESSTARIIKAQESLLDIQNHIN